MLGDPLDETELLQSLKKMKKDTSPGLDGLTVEFYQNFWDLVGECPGEYRVCR